MDTFQRLSNRRSADDSLVEQYSRHSGHLGVPKELGISMPSLSLFVLAKPENEFSSSRERFARFKKPNWNNFRAPSGGFKKLKFLVPKRRARAKKNHEKELEREEESRYINKRY